MTEDEAKQKICPFRHMDGYNFYAPRNPANCLASQCMMWRWGAKQPGENTYGKCGLVNEN